MTLLDRSVVPLPLLAKLERTDRETDLSWHSLVDHSADVAAGMETLLALPLVQSRLAALAGVERLPDVWVPRIAAHRFCTTSERQIVAFALCCGEARRQSGTWFMPWP